MHTHPRPLGASHHPTPNAELWLQSFSLQHMLVQEPRRQLRSLQHWDICEIKLLSYSRKLTPTILHRILNRPQLSPLRSDLVRIFIKVHSAFLSYHRIDMTFQEENSKFLVYLLLMQAFLGLETSQLAFMCPGVKIFF